MTKIKDWATEIIHIKTKKKYRQTSHHCGKYQNNQ
jgi:hypothetical protein